MDWSEMVRWHDQHMRITEEKLQMSQVMGQMTTLSTLAGVASPQARTEEPDND